jgi:hypothetical protein
VSSTRQDLLTLRGHLCSTQGFGGVRVALFYYDKIPEFNIAISNYSLCIAIKRFRIPNDNQKGTFQRNWQHMIHNTEDENKQNHNTICIGHHCTQTNTNKVDKI